MACVLLVSGDDDAARLLEAVLAVDGFDVARVHDGAQCLTSARDTQPEIILIDTPLEDLDGLELCHRLRGVTEAPIVVLAADVREADIIQALELGADEYLSRPLRPRELAARVRALLRRTNGFTTPAARGRLTLGDLEIDLDTRRVHKRGKPVELSPIEFRLLVRLASKPGRVINHRTLMAQVWGAEYVGCRHYLRLYIRYLRSKLEDDPRDPKMILNEWGIGYRFEAVPSSET